MTIRVGVDAGGTFTDLCLMDQNGAIAIYKLASTPTDPSEAIIEGVIRLLKLAGTEPRAVSYLGHGTTVATNTLLEGNGARVGLITTEGFRDLLELGRQRRPDLYDLQVDKPTPLVRRALRYEVPERVLPNGDVLRPLDLDAVREALRRLRSAGTEALAVCFLYSYLRPEHEDMVAAIAREELPDIFISLSHEVLAEFREYERFSTTVVNSFVGPRMSRYIRQLRERLRRVGVRVEPYITQSNGGLISPEVAAELPVRSVLSGPAAGVVGAVSVANAAGFTDIITFDMGGTSTDVALVTGGKPSLKMEQEVAGYPIRTPMLDIHTVGAGGGSIAWIDSGGHVKVGPRSAGADPGPACYGKGGRDATVTDANVTLGLLSREALLGGRMPIDAAAADRAVDALAARLRLSREVVAQGIIALATASMARAIRVISVERGYDPRDYTLVAFGGAGPLHAARLARELDIPRVLVPPIPGILCAYGLLTADLRVDFSRTHPASLTPEALPGIQHTFAELLEQAERWFVLEGIPETRRRLRRVADMRYVGQNYELSVELPSRFLTAEDVPVVLEAFHKAHDFAYGYAAEGEPVQVVTLRLEATGIVPKPLPQRVPPGASIEDARIGTRYAYLPENGGWGAVPLYDRSRLGAGLCLPGPAIVEQMDSTVLVLPGQRADVDDYGNVILREDE